MENLQKEDFPESEKGQLKEPIIVQVDTLDNIFSKTLPLENILLKIDAQRFEDKVLEGSNSFLKHVKVVILEMSLRKLYIG